MNQNFFASRLSQLREQKGYSARDMSLSMGQGESYINKVENKRILPSLSVFFIICEHLNISERDFFDEGNNYPEQLTEMIEDIKRLDKDSFNHIAGLIKIIANKK